VVVSDAVALPLETPSWRFDPREWLDAVRARWPSATGVVVGRDDRETVAYAMLPSSGGRLEVGLRSDLRTVAFEPLLPEPIADFVEWWAARLPAYEPPVHLFVLPDADRSLPLTEGLTAEQVRAFIGG
jgi:hypothetical protein